MTTKKNTNGGNGGNVNGYDLASIKGWADLEKNEQALIRQETVEVDRARAQIGDGKMAAGEHLFRIREILEPKRIFTKFLTTINLSRATAYRYIDLFTETRNVLPAPYLKQVMLRGTDRINMAAIAASPPPSTTNAVKINEYLDEMEKPGPRIVPQPRDPETLRKECVNFVQSRFQALPKAGRVRPAWMRQFLGMCLTISGETQAVTIAPVAIPEGYRVTRGRPKKMAA